MRVGHQAGACGRRTPPSERMQRQTRHLFPSGRLTGHSSQINVFFCSRAPLRVTTQYQSSSASPRRLSPPGQAHVIRKAPVTIYWYHCGVLSVMSIEPTARPNMLPPHSLCALSARSCTHAGLWCVGTRHIARTANTSPFGCARASALYQSTTGATGCGALTKSTADATGCGALPVDSRR